MNAVKTTYIHAFAKVERGKKEMESNRKREREREREERIPL